ncbi:hypothetical protein D0Z08_19715 [Nocardioides immobilis]|uniref:Uncharacterized protein n=2 Tax=Nocardioides immobilis TaxID=2049295 RepID=A0A417XYL2_9ACTN|nr:hypothetical protein D0Z08_19715 [Nocardioides immobilis]
MVQRQLLDAIEDGYGPVLSVFLDDPRRDETVEQVILRVCRGAGILNGKIQISSVGTLVEAGFELVHDDSDGMHETHHDVVFPNTTDIQWCQAFVDSFSEPRPNPAK